MSRNKKLLLAIVLVTFLVLFGAWREIIFININAQIRFNSEEIENSRVLPGLAFLSDIGTTSLVNLKWILTLAFTIVFLALGFLLFTKILEDNDGARWLVYLYGIGLVTSGILYIGGNLLGDPELGYTISRVVMGALQSPFIIMIMIPARMLAR